MTKQELKEFEKNPDLVAMRYDKRPTRRRVMAVPGEESVRAAYHPQLDEEVEDEQRKISAVPEKEHDSV